MPFPTEGWPPRPASGRRSVRIYLSGTTTANFSDNAFLFSQDPGANTFTPTPHVVPGSSETVTNGDLTRGGSPSGGSRDPRDASPIPPPVPMIWCNTMRIMNDGAADIEFSFDGTIVQGLLKAGEKLEYRERMEAGISIRAPGGTGVAWRLEAW